MVVLKFKAAIIEEYQKPFAVREVNVPDKPREGWVRVRVKAVGMCGRDLVVWKGGFPNLKPPIIPGHEIFGELNGEPVSVYPAILDCSTGECRVLILGENLPGGYAEYVDVPAENIVKLPTGEYEKYAASVCGVATLIHASRIAGIKPGDSALVTGATGGVGIHGIQYLVQLGVKVYAYTRRKEHNELLESLGAISVNDPLFYKKYGRVDYVFENVGAPVINDSLRSLKQRGTLVLIGNTEGTPITLNRPAMIVQRELIVKGSMAFTHDEWVEAIRLVGEGKIKPVYKAYRLDDINEAVESVLKGRRVGRIVLLP
ncbi:MAG: zinc-binding dehydrogenase [Desulfurococcales archaeon]|nr:zinc-binding dehydrogenase [Desulfurococcales archaeon]